MKWNYDTNISLRGGLTSLRAVIKKQNKTKKVSFYSDVRAILYAPLKKGHILEANATNKKAFLPYSYLSNKRLQTDNGVQLSYISSDIKKISMAYYPQGRKEGLKSLQATAFGESGTMFLRVNTGATNKDVIASITYIPEYANSIFYISFNGRLFQGRFADSNSFDTDGNAYNLEGSTISVDTFTNGTALQADTTRGMFIEGGQGISK